MNYRNFLSILIIASMFGCYQPKETKESEKFNFISKWQSLNDPNFVIEFGKDGKYHLYRNGQEVVEFIYRLDKQEFNKYTVRIYSHDTTEVPTKLNIEIVTPARIRIYSWKHHKILDWADEFNRTNDLNSFDSIMKKILKEPE